MSNLVDFFYRSTAGAGYAKAKDYVPGNSYKQNTLILSTDRQTLYVALQDFIATNEADDISNGFIQVVSGAGGAGYKRQVFADVSENTTVTIPLTTKNLQYNRHVFVLKLASSNTIQEKNYIPETLTWNKSLDIVVDSSGLYLNIHDLFTLIDFGNYKKATIENIGDYNEIVEINVL
jgi:hypothetical protein